MSYCGKQTLHLTCHTKDKTSINLPPLTDLVVRNHQTQGQGHKAIKRGGNDNGTNDADGQAL